MDGLLLVDKPAGWTSFDVVNYVRKIIANSEGKKPRNIKVGHTGTLDPLATGLLVLAIGGYCKRAAEFSKLDKTYEATMKLGETSTTGDEEGAKTTVSDFVPLLEAIIAAAGRFTGEIEQVPPAYSAIKINGVRAYKLARAGKEVIIQPRLTTVYSIARIVYTYPLISFTADVSSGTYIRTLVDDIGKELKTGAYMSGLRRMSVGVFKLTDATLTENLNYETIRLKLVTV